VSTRAQDQPRPDQLVDALNGVFGKHYRAAYTKGICLAGQFTPAPDAPSLSTPALFVEFLQIVGSGDKDKLNAFFQAQRN
jgi:catalase